MQPAELQARLIADYLVGEVAFPDAETMRREMLEMQGANDRRFVRSTRHTMEVDFVPFLHSLRRVHKRGQRLAARRGGKQPIAARAA